VNVIGNHMKLVEEMHTFHLDLTLLNLEVCIFIFIHSKVLTRSTLNLKI